MNPRLLASVLAVPLLMTAGCASMDGARTAAAPEPAKPIDVARFYTGRWYEIARTPMKLTDGCVAGATDYTPGPDGGIVDTDAAARTRPPASSRPSPAR